jgi:hypothetical protein
MGAPRAEALRSSLRLPAFGRKLIDLRKRGLRPESIIVVGIDSWDYGKAYARVVVSKDKLAHQLNFAFVAALDVAIVWIPEITAIDRRDSVARQVLKFDPASLRIIQMADPVVWLWIKSRAHGLEMPEYLA